jgi:hypothetical protein
MMGYEDIQPFLLMWGQMFPNQLDPSARWALLREGPHALFEIQVRYLLINDSLAKTDSLKVRFFLRWVSGVSRKGTRIDDATAFPRYSNMGFPLASTEELERE